MDVKSQASALVRTTDVGKQRSERLLSALFNKIDPQDERLKLPKH